VRTTINQGEVIPVSPDVVVETQQRQRIGTILVQAGHLTLETAERILKLQHQTGLRFGEAGIQLGLLTQDDVDFALARQFDCPYLTPGTSKVSEKVAAAYAPPFSPQLRALGTLRGQLMLQWFDSDPPHKALAIISAERGEGRSFITSNLAVSFAQLGRKTLLIDADLRNPCQQVLFGLNNRNGLSTILSGRGESEALMRRIPGLPSLFVLPAGPLPPNPVEVLARPPFGKLLEQLAREFEVILLDSPSAAEHPEAQTVAVRAGAAIIVARKNYTRMWRMRGVSDQVTHARTTILGTVLNDF